MTAARLKDVADIRVSNVDKKITEGETQVRLCNYTDVYYNPRVTGDLPFMVATASTEQVQRFGLRRGDVVITKDSETADDIAVPARIETDASDLVCGYHLAIIRPNSADLDARYLYWTMASSPTREFYTTAATGVTRFGLRQDSIGDLRVRLPAGPEQRAIADFLDAETARIDSLIQLRYRMRVLGTERHRTSLDALFRSEAWPAQKLKHLLRAPACYGVLVPRFVQSDGIRFIRVNDLADLDVRGPDLVQIEMDQSREYRRTLVQAGDVLTSVVGSIDKAALVTADLTGCNIARAVARLRPRADVSGDLLLAWLRTSDYQRQARLATGSDTAQPTLNMGDLANFRIRWPPPDQAIRALGMIARTERWQAASDVALRKQIDLLRERRQALITAAVTGEIDVSSAGGRGVPA